jgi:DNA polymerase-3 subunit epsilon
MNALRLLFVDVETTGTDPNRNGIIQLSGIIDINGTEVERFNYQIKPYDDCEYTEEALKVNNTTKGEIDNFPPESEVFAKFDIRLKSNTVEFSKADKYYIIGYNVFFDKEFMFKFYSRNNGKLQYYCWGNPIDIMTLASQRLIMERPNLKDFKLATVARYLGIQVADSRLHDAMYDVELTRELYYLLLKNEFKTVTDKGELIQSLQTTQINTVKDTRREINSLEDVLDFGKWKNRTISKILSDDPQYILWLKDNVAKLNISSDIIVKAQSAADNNKANKKINVPSVNNSSVLDDMIDSNPGLMPDNAYDYPF